MRIRKVCS